MTIRVVHVDDHKLFVSGVGQLLHTASDIEAVGHGHSGASVQALLRELKPDVLLLDVELSDSDGIQLARQVAALYPEMRIVCLSMHGEAEIIEAMLRAGATAYVLKDCDAEELLTAIRAAARGEAYVSRSVGRALAEAARKPKHNRFAPNAVELSQREREVLTLLADGLSTKQIAGAIGVSLKTISTYRSRLMKKLGVRSVAGLTKFALRTGLTSLDRGC